VLKVALALFTGPAWKPYLAAIITAIAWSYPLEGLRVAVITSLALLAFDFVLGMYASLAIRGEKLDPRKLVRSAMKIFVYTAFPVAVWKSLMVLALSRDVALAVAGGIAALAVATEFVSIARHLNETRLFPVPKWLTKLLEDRIKDLSGSKLPSSLGKPDRGEGR
jgi:hypothetical protein